MCPNTPVVDDILDPSDFNSITFDISLRNITTNTEAGSGIKDPEARKVMLIEFLEKGLVFELPAHCGAKGHNVMFTIKSHGARPEISFQATAKIEDIEGLSQTRFRANVTLVQYEEETWEKFQGLFTKRQREIDDFFAAVKG